MATVVLAAAGGALGASAGGSVLGLSSVAIGKAIGATIGAVIDQRLFGAGSDPVDIGRRDQFRLTGSSEGAPIARLWGQMRLSGQLIWSSNFIEDVTVSGGGKGAPSGPERREYAYSVSLALAVCEGPITRIGRVWADGQVLDTGALNWRIYKGHEDQLPDALIAASRDDGQAPAYRGTAYVVIENLPLGQFGNRIPQFNFEVMRQAENVPDEPVRAIKAVALVPGTGEYALATEPVSFAIDKGVTKVANVNNDTGRPDAELALENLIEEVPSLEASSLVVSWFGSDLRCDRCVIEPKVEQDALDGGEMPWVVSGQPRSGAAVVQSVDGRPGFGGTPADAAVVQSIKALSAAGQAVMFYPFILMDIRAGNGLADPWTGQGEQPPVPWRGRITASVAPGRAGSPDTTAALGAEVDAFFGTAAVGDFAILDGAVVYSGANEWSYRRFILHYAHLCQLAGGVEAFCIGSELRGLTQLRDGPESFPVVAHLRVLAGEVRAILGPGTKISYAADWSEYFGYQTNDGSGDVFYHLDPLWADPDIDFIGIDNYMPISDWRDGDTHADASWPSIYDLDYLRANIEGGEGYDWYYASQLKRDAQVRTPITDGAYDEPWTFRYKDIRNWWGRYHWDRIGGVKNSAPTQWQPESKPIWFTELGCPAVDKGTNQPNVFLDPQSSENSLPHYSNGGQDRFIQRRYLEAIHTYWADAQNNPQSKLYPGSMLDMSRAFVWAWDMRPWPDYPKRLDVWSDGPNHGRGHWISGRAQLVALQDAVREICARAGVSNVDVSRLHGVLQGYHVAGTETARASLQPLMLAYGFDAYERDGLLTFRNRDAKPLRSIDRARLAVPSGGNGDYELSRAPEADMPARVRITYVHPQKDYQTSAAEAQTAGAEAIYAAGSDLPLALDHVEARALAARWLAETQVSRDRLKISLPPSDIDLGPGDVFAMQSGGSEQLFRIDRVTETGARDIEAVRVEADLYAADPIVSELVVTRGENQAGQPYLEVLDLPLLSGDESAHAPHVAVAHVPWDGAMAVYSGAQDHGYSAPEVAAVSSVVGRTLDDLPRAAQARWAEQSIRVEVRGGQLQSRQAEEVLSGANVAAIRGAGDQDWEVLQFRDAVLEGENTYRLSGFLRGQAGTEAMIGTPTVAGADFVLLDGRAVQPVLPLDRLGVERHYRAGPADRAYSDDRYAHQVFTPMGVGLRPYAPAHLAVAQSSGDLEVSWVRRSRIGGDSWAFAEVPLGEAREAYHLRILASGALLREVETSAPTYTYTAAAQAADGASDPITFEVAQISDVVGPGSYARITTNG